jgi:hypothetical protein
VTSDEPEEPAETASTAAPTALTPEYMRQIRILIKRGNATTLATRAAIDGPIEITIASSLSRRRVRRTQLATQQELTTWLRRMRARWGPECAGADPPASCEWDNGLHIRSPVSCDATCCRQTHAALVHGTLFLDAVCFEMRPNALPRITSIAFTDGD